MQQKANSVCVEGDHGERRHAGKTVRLVRQNPFETAVPEVIDRRLYCRMLVTHCHEFIALLSLSLRRGEVARHRQQIVIEQFVKAIPVPGAVKAAVEAHRAEIGKPYDDITRPILRRSRPESVPFRGL